MDMKALGRLLVLGLLLGGAGLGPAMAQHTFDGNIFWDNSIRWCYVDNSLAWDACDFGTFFAHNDTLSNPQLGDPYNQEHPDWVPAWGSPAIGHFDEVADFNPAPVDTCFSGNCELPELTPVCYRGAIPPAAWGADWTAEWTYYMNNGQDEDGNDRTDIDYAKPVVTLTGAQAGDVHLTADSNYLVSGRFSMSDGTTLYIDPGVVVFGDFNLVSYIVIERGREDRRAGHPRPADHLHQRPGSRARWPPATSAAS